MPIIVILILALLLVVFTLQNTTLVTLKVFWWQVPDVPLVLALLICLAGGFIVAYILYAPLIWKLKHKIREQQKQLGKVREATGKETLEDMEVIRSEDEEEFFS